VASASADLKGKNMLEDTSYDRIQTRLIFSQLPYLGGRLQRLVANWVIKTFGPKFQSSSEERVKRFAEEAIEVMQAGLMTREEVHHLVDMKFNGDPGPIGLEMSQVLFTLLTLAENKDINLLAILESEIERIHEPAVMVKCREKWIKKWKTGQVATSLTYKDLVHEQ
jgi:phosphoribosyl-ATP pyrophosphohydrolase